MSTQEGPERKRRRKVLSCWDCRRRKLQCDRAMPACGRCTKAGKVDSCLYIDDPLGDTGNAQAENMRPQQSSSPGGRDFSTKLDAREKRIRDLEHALAQTGRMSSRLPPTPTSEDPTSTAIDRESMVLRGKSFKTRYFGSTHPGAVITFIPELRDLTKEAFERYPALSQMRLDMRALEERLVDEDANIIQVYDQDLKAMLPPKEDTDELVHLYIDTFETLYHILHLPSFWQSYEEMWKDMNGSSGHFVATVLSMMACVACLSSQPQRYVAQSSTTRNRCLHWLRMIEIWLQRRSHKHVSAADFQIRCLLWLGRTMCARKAKRQWSEAGNLLRFCMSAGLHRDPDLIKKETSALDKELRRRVWATVVDFELQASFDRGMVSAPWLLQSDCPAPSNVHDDTLDKSLPLTDFTTTSYLALAHQSLMLRSTLNAVLNNIRQVLSFEETKQYTEEIESHLANIPDWKDRRSDMPKALLSLRLQQYLIVLHERQLRQANTATERNFSKMVLLDTALQVIETHKSLVASGNLALDVYCFDPLRVAVSVAHLQTWVQPDISFSRSFYHLTPALMEDIVSLIQEKFYRMGDVGRELWLSIMCDTCMKIQRDPTQRDTLLQQAIEKVVSPMYKIIACQEPTPATESTSRSNEVFNTPGVLLSPSGILNTGVLNLDDINDWTFQDWFATTDYQSIYQSIPDLTFDPLQDQQKAQYRTEPENG